MRRDTIVLRTKLLPPPLPRQTLVRARVDKLLRSAFDHPLTIVQASTGYGKSTALAQLTRFPEPLYWYSAAAGDSDAQQFLAHLISAFRVRLENIGDTPLALLQERGAVLAAIDTLLNKLSETLDAPALLVIDDFHFAASPDVNALLEYLIEFLPSPLHVIVASRYPPAWDALALWRAQGKVLEIKRDALAFTRDEIVALFHETYGIPLAPREIDLLYEMTEGWSIALQLVRQELRDNPNANLAALFERDTTTRERTASEETLFAYLARDVLAKQPPALQAFLLETSVLRELDIAACDAVRQRTDSAALCAQIIQRDLFVTGASEGHLRYHHLFEDFLRELASRQDEAAVRLRHTRAADFYRAGGNTEEALFHLFRAGDFENAAQCIERVAEDVVRAGRLDTLAAWLDVLPPAAVAARPFLIFMWGELARLRSRYDEALAWYAQAEREWRAARDVSGITRALRGQALVYLDTVRPAQAEGVLEQALRLSDGLEDRRAHARLLELLAENKLNMGRATEAEELRAQAQRLRDEGPSEDTLSVRVKLRTGRLDEARTILEAWAEQERDQPHAPRAVRETFLILALIYAMQGRADAAYAAARDGIALGNRFDSPFVTAIGLARLGHAEQVRGELAAAQEAYQSAIRLADERALPRLRAEIMWGLTRVYGYNGDLASAQRTAAEGIQVAGNAGDEWVVALVRLALGASHVLARQDDASMAILNDALAGFRACGDRFGRAVTHLWLALAHSHLKQQERALTHLDEALALGEREHFDYVFTLRTLHGWHDARVGVPLLLHARQRGLHAAYVTRLLSAMHLEQLTAHPGYQLRVQTLGAFRVWRGTVEIRATEWQRRKARQLFQLFLTYRGRMLEREEIFELLWANETPDAMLRDFKVALNQVNRVLEPERATDERTAFIEREGTAYGLRAGADVWIDADEFAQLLERADAARDDNALDLYRRALALYQDDYLNLEARYDAWASAERERLLGMYLRAADRLATELFARGSHAECLVWCEKILARDRCWEHAYRLKMRAYAARGDNAQARRVFEQCAQSLRRDLDMEPSPATLQVFKEINTAT
jgi:ATP/maltotriose-dependent transcriptional regulator MalT/DNA-binding SARP family transcriptional activator